MKRIRVLRMIMMVNRMAVLKRRFTVMKRAWRVTMIMASMMEIAEIITMNLWKRASFIIEALESDYSDAPKKLWSAFYLDSAIMLCLFTLMCCCLPTARDTQV